MKRLNIVIAIALVVFTGYCASVLIHKGRTEKVKDLQLQTKTIDLKKLELDTRSLNAKYDEALKEKETHTEQVKQLEDERVKLQEQLDQAQRELQAKVKAKQDSLEASRIAFNTLSGTKTASAQTNDVEGIVRAAAIKYGVSPDHLANIARCESGFNPNAVNHSYNSNGNPSGLFQHISGYWPARAAKYGFAGASVFDAQAQAEVTAQMFRDGLQGLWECR